MQASYYEAVVEQILPDEQSVVACFPKDVGFPQACFKVRLWSGTQCPVCGQNYGPPLYSSLQTFCARSGPVSDTTPSPFSHPLYLKLINCMIEIRGWFQCASTPVPRDCSAFYASRCESLGVYLLANCWTLRKLKVLLSDSSPIIVVRRGNGCDLYYGDSDLIGGTSVH